MLREVDKRFPTVTTIRVKEALDAVNDLVSELAVAVRGASSVALLASILVLAGALSCRPAGALYDAVVLKVLGATRLRLLAAFLANSGFSAFSPRFSAFWLERRRLTRSLHRVMHLDFVWLWPQALIAAGGALLLTIVLGLLSTWRILGRSPAPYLREL